MNTIQGVNFSAPLILDSIPRYLYHEWLAKKHSNNEWFAGILQHTRLCFAILLSVSGALAFWHANELATLNALNVSTTADTVAFEAARDAVPWPAPIAPRLTVGDTEAKRGVLGTPWGAACDRNAGLLSVSWIPHISRRAGTPSYAVLRAMPGYRSVAR